MFHARSERVEAIRARHKQEQREPVPFIEQPCCAVCCDEYGKPVPWPCDTIQLADQLEALCAERERLAAHFVSIEAVLDRYPVGDMNAAIESRIGLLIKTLQQAERERDELKNHRSSKTVWLIEYNPGAVLQYWGGRWWHEGGSHNHWTPNAHEAVWFYDKESAEETLKCFRDDLGGEKATVADHVFYFEPAELLERFYKAEAREAALREALKECKALFDSEEYKGVCTFLSIHGFRGWSGPKVDMDKLNTLLADGQGRG